MVGEQPDELDRWLTAEGRATLDAVTRGSPDAFCVMNRELVIRYLNWSMPGTTPEMFIGQPVWSVVAPQYVELTRAALERALEGEQGQFETMYPGEDGVSIWVVRVGPVVHEGKVIGALSINTDATQQRRADADRDRFFSLSLDMLVVVAADGHLKRVNPAFGQALGYDAAELLGRPFTDFVHTEDAPRTQAWFAEILEGKQLSDFENRHLRRDGTPRVLSWRATVDPITGFVFAVARDITGQRAAETQLRHAQKMEAVGQLAGGIAHDFNNLLQAVLANVELAQMSHSPSAISEHLEEIAGAGRRAADLTKQLLVFSRRQALQREPLDLNGLLQDLLKLLRRLLPESISIDLACGELLGSVSADRTQIEQVVINLCVNARDAMERGGKLTLETDHLTIDERDCEVHPWAKPGRFARLTVTDTGVGMPPEVRERAFDPFYTTKDPQGGTGLGLATVYGIVQQHGGLIHLYSEVGHGSTFKIYLPLDDRPPMVRPTHSAQGSVPAMQRETILIAEDEELVRRPVVLILESAGYRTRSVTNGREAIEFLKEATERIDLVLLDVVMPEIGGPEAWEQIRVARPDLKVIFTSGYADDRYRDRLPSDATILEKPFRTQELLDALRQTLDR